MIDLAKRDRQARPIHDEFVDLYTGLVFEHWHAYQDGKLDKPNFDSWMWRKRSYGSQSERGNRFAERLMTVAHTARKQGKNVLEFLTACCQAQAAREPAPTLLG